MSYVHIKYLLPCKYCLCVCIFKTQSVHTLWAEPFLCVLYCKCRVFYSMGHKRYCMIYCPLKVERIVIKKSFIKLTNLPCINNLSTQNITLTMNMHFQRIIKFFSHNQTDTFWNLRRGMFSLTPTAFEC